MLQDRVIQTIFQDFSEVTAALSLKNCYLKPRKSKAGLKVTAQRTARHICVKEKYK